MRATLTGRGVRVERNERVVLNDTYDVVSCEDGRNETLLLVLKDPVERYHDGKRKLPCTIRCQVLASSVKFS